MPMNKKNTLCNPHLIIKNPMPKRQTNLFLLRYAASYQVIKSKFFGNIDVFLN